MVRVTARWIKKLIILCISTLLLLATVLYLSLALIRGGSSPVLFHQQQTTTDTTTANTRADSHQSVTDEEEQSVLIDASTAGRLNYDQWKCPPFVGYLVDDLRIHQHDWPYNPTLRQSSQSVHIAAENILHFGAKLYGYLLPPDTGLYQFSIVHSLSTAALTGELWISTDHSPMSLRKIANVTCSIKERQSGACGNSSAPVFINLESHRMYYFEFHVKSFKGLLNMEVLWKLPHFEHLQRISSSFLAMAVKLNHSSNILPKNLPSNKIQSIGYTKPNTTNISNVMELNILPSCQYTPSYVKVEPVEQYKGYYKVRESGIYPWDLNRYVYIRKLLPGNRMIAKSTVDFVHSLYLKEFNKNNLGKKVLGIHHMEETKYNTDGSRFLLEMDIQLESTGKIVQTSEYVYLPQQQQQLCHTSNFQWKRNVKVYVVVSVKNLGHWIKHLQHNMEDIYSYTRDDNFELVLVDYESTDINITREFEQSTLPHWKVISLQGRFSRSAGLQAGIDYVTDKNSIVMTIDMHLTLPLDFITNVRKHTIQGKMAYTPMFFKLEDGYTENNVNGYWQSGTYGLFGMYVSDWTSVGGFDVINYRYKWGGEDWDLLDRTVSKGIEAFRVRPPGLFHYYHTRIGMWGIHDNGHSC